MVLSTEDFSCTCLSQGRFCNFAEMPDAVSTQSMESKLVAAFKFFDLNGDGTINRSDLTEICKQLDPQNHADDKVDCILETLDREGHGYIDYSEFAVWMTSGMDSERIMSIYETAAAKMPGERLAEGDTLESGLNKIGLYTNHVLDILPEDYATPKVTKKLTWLREIADLLDPIQNPGDFRLCQKALLDRGAMVPLLGMARKSKSDAVVIKCLEVLARTAFGNIEAAIEVAGSEGFLPTLHHVITDGKQPEKLVALQLAQAIAAASTAPEIQELIPLLLAEVVPMLSNPSFMVLANASMDVLVSSS